MNRRRFLVGLLATSALAPVVSLAPETIIVTGVNENGDVVQELLRRLDAWDLGEGPSPEALRWLEFSRNNYSRLHKFVQGCTLPSTLQMAPKLEDEPYTVYGAGPWPYDKQGRYIGGANG